MRNSLERKKINVKKTKKKKKNNKNIHFAKVIYLASDGEHWKRKPKNEKEK